MAKTAKCRRKRVKKQKARERGSSARRSRGIPAPLLRAAGRLDVLEVLISRDWREEGELVQILVARRSLDGSILAGCYLVDLGCLGVKSAFAGAFPDETSYRRGLRARVISLQPTVETDLDHAAKVVYAGLRYARDIGFSPDPDFETARLLLDGADPDDCDLPVPLGGKDGKPFYVAGPHDDAWSVIDKLERRLGRDGFHFLAPMFRD